MLDLDGDRASLLVVGVDFLAPCCNFGVVVAAAVVTVVVVAERLHSCMSSCSAELVESGDNELLLLLLLLLMVVVPLDAVRLTECCLGCCGCMGEL